ncbi:DUF6124 family protein [Pseudomonas fluorescens]
MHYHAKRGNDLNLIFTVRPNLSTKVALSNASEILESATMCAYDGAEHLDGSSAESGVPRGLMAEAIYVGAGLPAMAVGQLADLWLTHCYRRQASSHICSVCIKGYLRHARAVAG